MTARPQRFAVAIRAGCLKNKKNITTLTMLQSEYDAIVRHKRLKIFLIILTTIMVVAMVLLVRKQFFVNDVLPSPVEGVVQPDLISAKEYKFQSDEEMEVFLNSGDPNAEMLRSYMDSGYVTNPNPSN